MIHTRCLPRATHMPGKFRAFPVGRVAYGPHSKVPCRSSATLFLGLSDKKIEYTRTSGVHSLQLTRRDARAFWRAFEKSRFRATTRWLKETRRQRSVEQRVNPQFTFLEKPRCQTLKSRVRSAALHSCLLNVNRSTTGNVT